MCVLLCSANRWQCIKFTLFYKQYAGVVRRNVAEAHCHALQCRQIDSATYILAHNEFAYIVRCIQPLPPVYIRTTIVAHIDLLTLCEANQSVEQLIKTYYIYANCRCNIFPSPGQWQRYQWGWSTQHLKRDNNGITWLWSLSSSRLRMALFLSEMVSQLLPTDFGKNLYFMCLQYFLK